MRSPVRALVTVAALAAAGLATPASAAPVAHDGPTAASAASSRTDDRPGPRTKQQRALRAAALEKVAQGKAAPNDKGVVSLGKGKHVEVATTGTDKILTILADFGTAGDSKLGLTPGPVHNSIPEPDRTKDNSTYWTDDFNKAHYEQLFNGAEDSMQDYYEDLSNRKYSVVNTVENWVTLPYNGSTYGDNAVEDVGGSWRFVQDTGNAWWNAKVKELGSAAAVDAYLAQFDVWDRYDFDGDGNFDESDGYIDHFQAVHAGGGEEGGADSDAIWSHRWYVNGTDFGRTGPAGNLSGGARIGGSKYWFGDYTTEPENGGLGVFAHEFGHDLGLPDYYDTSGGENSTAFWTLMSSGSWLNKGALDIGTTPGLMGPEEKLFLGWLDHSRVAPGTSGSYVLNASQLQVRGKDQAVRVDLPAKTTTASYTTVPSGTGWWTGRGDGLNETLTTSTTIPAGSTTIGAQAWYDIEAGYDYLYGEYSTNGGATWTPVGSPIDGASGRWKNATWRYSTTTPSLFRFRYQTDGGVNQPGAFLDGMTVNGVERADSAWTPTGLWKLSSGQETTTTEQYYLVENRQYVGYDATLQTGPYQFNKAYTAPDWVERFAFQKGMLVWYVDDAYADNNVAEHPGAGAAMVVDARPAPIVYSDGTKPSNRRQPFDATFGLNRIDSTCLHKEVLVGTGKNQTVSTLAACNTEPMRTPIATFDDTARDAYYSTANPQGSVKVAGHGVKVTVSGATGTDLTISVSNPAG